MKVDCVLLQISRALADGPGLADGGASSWTAPTDPVEFARRLLRFDPDEKQSEVLRTSVNQVLVCCTRQWGKSTVGAIGAVHHMLLRPDAFVVVVAPTERQAGELVRKARVMLKRAGVTPRSDGHTRFSIVLPNGSRMIALPSTDATSRCYSGVTMLIADEAAHVRDAVIDAARPFLATTNGVLWMISTPRGKRGRFWEAWELEGDDWVRFTVKAEDCPRISREFLAREKKRGERRYRQEYGCEFLDQAGGVFDVGLLLQRVTKEFEPLRV